MRLFLATGNPGKLREIRAIMSGIEVDPPPAAWISPEETGDTYLANALLKARSLSALTGEPVLADDSGIEVDALKGAPGVRSARFAGESATDEENLRLMIERISPVAEPARTARYRCVAVLVGPGDVVLHAEGTVEGRLITSPRGSGGFGYDPIFVAAGEDRTMAEMSADEKDAISHRGAAFRALRDLMSSRPAR